MAKMNMRIQRNDIVYIGLGMSSGAWGGWFFAHHWLAVLVGLVCGCGGGTVAAIAARLCQARHTADLGR